MRKSIAFPSFLAAIVLSACGGGVGGDSGGETQPPVSAYTPPAHVVAAKQLNYATPFYGSTGAGSGCNNIKSTTVYVLPNTITYAADGVTELAQQQAADYAEQAVSSIRGTLGLTGTVGMGKTDGLRVTSTNSSSLESSFLVNDFDIYKRLIKHEMVHVFHQAVFGNNNAVLDAWFAEGLAEFIASEKSSKSKTEILNLVNTQYPIAVTTTGIVAEAAI